MTFREIDVEGVLVSPVAVLIAGSWVVVAVLRWQLRRSGLLQRFWHPALVLFSAYVLILSASTWLVTR